VGCTHTLSNTLLNLIVKGRQSRPKGWFPHDRHDRWQKRSAIVAIMWKPLFSHQNDHSNHMKTSPNENCLAIKVATTPQLFW